MITLSVMSEISLFFQGPHFLLAAETIGQVTCHAKPDYGPRTSESEARGPLAGCLLSHGQRRRFAIYEKAGVLRYLRAV